MSKPVLTIDVVSDVVCPWCYLGKRRLERAFGLVPEIAVDIRWRPYRLDPTIPPEGIDRADYVIRKFGSAAALDQAHARLEQNGRDEGVEYHFERIKRSPSTVDAHRLVRWAEAEGVQGAMVERLFAAYFSEGRDVGDKGVLAELAGEVGLTRDSIARRLASEEDYATTIAAIDNAFQIGVTGVPCFIFDSRAALMGAQPAEVLARAMSGVVQHRAEAEAPPA